MLNDLHAEIEWHSGILTALGGTPPCIGGTTASARASETYYEAFGETQIEYTEIRDLGSRTFGIGRFRAQGPGERSRD